jgi:hypothetical protein
MRSASDLRLGELVLRGFAYAPADDTLDAGQGDLWVASTREGDILLASDEGEPPTGVVVPWLRGRRWERDGKVTLTFPDGSVRELEGVELILNAPPAAA